MRLRSCWGWISCLGLALVACGPPGDGTTADDDGAGDDALDDDDDFTPADTKWLTLVVPRDATQAPGVRSHWLLLAGDGTTDRLAVSQVERERASARPVRVHEKHFVRPTRPPTGAA